VDVTDWDESQTTSPVFNLNPEIYLFIYYIYLLYLFVIIFSPLNYSEYDAICCMCANCWCIETHSSRCLCMFHYYVIFLLRTRGSRGYSGMMMMMMMMMLMKLN